MRDNELISVNQSGFIPGDSTVNQLVSIHQDICMALENHTDRQLILIYQKPLIRYGIQVFCSI